MTDNRKKVEAVVKNCYSTWSDNYYQDYYQSSSAYPPVHTEIVRQLLKDSKSKNVLDAGCGPASMLRDLSGLGLDRYGFDLTPEMVIEAKSILSEQGVDPKNIWQGSVLDVDSFNNSIHPQKFDSVISIGVMPHISTVDELCMIENMVSAVKKGGRVVLEARNALFAMFSFNRYSSEFIKNNLLDVNSLSDRAGSDKSALNDAIAELDKHFSLDMPPIRKGKQDELGYDEVLSRTHIPFELKQQVEAAGLTEVEILFYHYHCLPPMLEEKLPDFFRKESLRLESPYDWRGHFMASAFLVTGVGA